jgi:hypothetical protein
MPMLNDSNLSRVEISQLLESVASHKALDDALLYDHAAADANLFPFRRGFLVTPFDRVAHILGHEFPCGENCPISDVRWAEIMLSGDKPWQPELSRTTISLKKPTTLKAPAHSCVFN